MITKTKQKHKLYDDTLLLHVLGNDYIVYSKIIDKQKSFDSLYNKIDLYPYRRQFIIYVRVIFVFLDDNLVLVSLDTSKLSHQNLMKILERIVIYTSTIRLFEHMREFIKDQKIDRYKAGYEELNREINDISRNIVDYVINKYPDAQADEALLKNIKEVLWAYLSKSIDGFRTKIIDNCYSLLKSPIIIRFRDLEIKMEKLLGIKPHYGSESDSKTKKNFIINAAISSFIKVLPFKLWQLSNEDALSILVKPQVEYEVVHDKDYEHAIRIMEKSKVNRAESIFIEPSYRLILVIDYTLSNSIKPIRVSLNIFGLYFHLKSKSINKFVTSLNEVINNVYEKTIKELLEGYLICNRLAV